MTSSRPADGWYPDPYGSGGLRRWDGDKWTPQLAPPPPPPIPYAYRPMDVLPPLDRAVTAAKEHDPRPWGLRPALLPCVAGIVAVAFGTAATHVITPSSFTGQFVATIILNIAIYGLLGTAVWWAGRDIAARLGGWGIAVGLRRPCRNDVGYVAAGFGVAFAARIVVSVVADALTHGTATSQSRNLRLHTNSIPVDVLLVVLVVVLAPIVEEIIFRGLLLRAFMRRLDFWPAALASTFIFAMFHTYEVATLTGAATLAAVVATLGLTNCYLVRLTDRLAPGMFVHASFNALATGVLIYQASH